MDKKFTKDLMLAILYTIIFLVALSIVTDVAAQQNTQYDHLNYNHNHTSRDYGYIDNSAAISEQQNTQIQMQMYQQELLEQQEKYHKEYMNSIHNSDLWR